MGFRFQKRIRLLPGITINLGKNGASYSFGPKGAKITVGKGGIRKTIGIPGTGMSYTTFTKFGGKKNTQQTVPVIQSQAQSDYSNIDLSFFSKLFLSGSEKIFIDGMKLFLSGDSMGALRLFQQIYSVADAAFVAAIIALNHQDFIEAQNALIAAEQAATDLGKMFDKYKLGLTLSSPITEFLSVELRPSIISVKLVEVEILQHNRDIAKACNILTDLCKQDSANLIVKISLAELVLTTSPNDKRWLQALINMTATLCNETPVHTVLLYYRATALRNLALIDAAIDVVTDALRMKAGREPKLLMALKEIRAECYEKSGRLALARKDWESIYSENPQHPLAARK